MNLQTKRMNDTVDAWHDAMVARLAASVTACNYPDDANFEAYRVAKESERCSWVEYRDATVATPSQP